MLIDEDEGRPDSGQDDSLIVKAILCKERTHRRKGMSNLSGSSITTPNPLEDALVSTPLGDYSPGPVWTGTNTTIS